MSEEEMKALVEMSNKLKAKLEQQTKTYQQSLREMQREIDDLERNCDVFNEQMNDAVEVTVKLKQDKQELIEWLEDEINKLYPKKLELGELNLILDDVKFYSYIQLKDILEKLGE